MNTSKKTEQEIRRLSKEYADLDDSEVEILEEIYQRRRRECVNNATLMQNSITHFNGN